MKVDEKRCPIKSIDGRVYRLILPSECVETVAVDPAGRAEPVGGAAESELHNSKHGGILVNETEAQTDKKTTMISSMYGHMVSYMKRLPAGKTPEEALEVWTLDDMTLGWKFVCILFAAIPRLLICLLLGFIGAIYIGRSESQEAMILNTLAVLFVLDIDDSIYNVFTSGSLKVHMDHIKPIVLHPSNNDRLIAFFFASFIFPVLVVAISVVIVEKDVENGLSVEWFAESRRYIIGKPASKAAVVAN